MVSRTKIKLRIKKKTNFELVETISLAMKHDAWKDMAKILSSSTRKQSKRNLYELENKVSLGDTIIVPGKILSKGNLTKKIRLCALSISKQAAEKLKSSKSEFVTIFQEIKKNPKAEGIKIIR